jgi:hypothetical protein
LAPDILGDLNASIPTPNQIQVVGDLAAFLTAAAARNHEAK